MEDPNKITYFAETDFRNKRTPFGIKAKDRTRHVYVIGKTGMGKSTLLENMAAQDLMNGEGMAFIDPHGSAVEKLLEYVPEERINDVVYFAPFDTDFPVSLNVLEDVGPDKRHLVASGLMSSFKKIWVDAWSARMEYILNNILLALLEYPGSTLLGVNRMLADKDYRKLVVDNVKDPGVRAFWIDEFAKYGDKYMQEAGAAIQNKIGQFTANPIIRNIIGQPRSSFDVRKMMDEKKILLINLSKGRIGEQNANLLGGMLITKIYLGAMSRADVSNQELKHLPYFYLYVDEFQSFASDSFADILSEARKYNLSLNIAHQYVEQMSEAVRAAVFGNVGTMIVFRVGAFDSEVFEKEFAPQFTAEDIVNLGLYQNYMRLMIDGVGSKPFSAVGMAPIPIPHRSFRDEIIQASRNNNAKPRPEVEASILKWHEAVPVEKKERIVRDGAPQGASGASGGPRQFEKRPYEQRSFEQRPYEQRPYEKRQPEQRPADDKGFSEQRHTGKQNYSGDRKSSEFARNEARRNENVRGDRDTNDMPPAPRREYKEPVRPKQSLQSLLNKLSIEPERPKGEEKVVDEPKAELVKPEPISLSSLKKSRTPDAKKIDDLRALLQKVVPQTASSSAQPTAAQVTQKPQHQVEKAPQGSSHTEQSHQKAAPLPPMPKTDAGNPKEVPEEVLRSILSS